MRVACLFACLVCSGCPTRGPHPGPEATLSAYLAALSAGRLDDAYALMSSDYKKTHDRAAFERALSPTDRAQASKRLAGAKVTLAAEVELPEPWGERLPMVYERSAWHFQRDPLDFYPQRHPEEALRSFMRAVENGRYEVALRFVPARYRATITVDKLRERWEGERRQELLGQLRDVRAHLGEPFEVDASGDAARLPLGERKQARLVREEGAWKVEALE